MKILIPAFFAFLQSGLFYALFCTWISWELFFAGYFFQLALITLWFFRNPQKWPAFFLLQALFLGPLGILGSTLSFFSACFFRSFKTELFQEKLLRESQENKVKEIAKSLAHDCYSVKAVSSFHDVLLFGNAEKKRKALFLMSHSKSFIPILQHYVKDCDYSVKVLAASLLQKQEKAYLERKGLAKSDQEIADYSYDYASSGLLAGAEKDLAIERAIEANKKIKKASLRVAKLLMMQERFDEACLELEDKETLEEKSLYLQALAAAGKWQIFHRVKEQVKLMKKTKKRPVFHAS